MKTRTAILRESPGKWEIVEVDLADPGPGEVTIKMVVAGLCHSDDHLCTGDMTAGFYPMAGGHEGAGVVVAVGENVRGYAEGDRVVVLCVASCGICKWCAMGLQNLCDLNANLLAGGSPEDPSRYRMHLDGEPVGQWVGVASFSEYTTVSTSSVMRVADDVPFDAIAMVSCGVTTGWGTAVNTAEIGPGDVAIVAGIGGVGMGAVQGARYAGASTVIAVDPVAFKRAKAAEFGATHAVATIEEATEIAKSLTDGQGADAAVLTIGVVQAEDVVQAFAGIRKGGVVAVAGMASMVDQAPLALPLAELTFYQKQLRGSLYGGVSPRWTIARLLDLYRTGDLKLDELVTTRYRLDDLNKAYDDMHAGVNLRGVVDFS